MAVVPEIWPSIVPRWIAIYTSDELIVTDDAPSALIVSAEYFEYPRIFKSAKSAGVLISRALFANWTKP